MKKITLLLLAILLLVGCTGKNGDQPDATATTPPNQIQDDGFTGLGDTMPDMVFHTIDGETLTLSELLDEKKLVVLNFWFRDCIWCKREFPVMELAYQRYRQDVEIVALNPKDSEEEIRSFRNNHALSFPVAACPGSWTLDMGVRAYPTSVFIDRDGVVCLIHQGAITNSQTFYDLFDAFTADDYERKVYGSIAEVIG